MKSSPAKVTLYVVNIGYEINDRSFIQELYQMLKQYKESMGVMVQYIANTPFEFDPQNIDSTFPSGVYIVPITNRTNTLLLNQLAVLSGYDRYMILPVYVEDCASLENPLCLLESLTEIPWERTNSGSKTKWWKQFKTTLQNALLQYRRNWFDTYVRH